MKSCCLRPHKGQGSPKARGLLPLRVVLPLLLAAWAAGAQAATVSWDGSGDGVSWLDARNWSADTLPGPGDDVSITAPGAVVTLGSGAVTVRSLSCPRTLRLTGGVLTVNEGASFIGGVLRQSGGQFAGTALIRQGTLELDGAGTVAATYVLEGATQLEGRIAPAQTVWVRGSNGGGHAAATWRHGWRNDGSLRLESVDGGWTSRLDLPEDAPADAFLVNGAGASLLAAHGSGGQRLLRGRLENRGRVVVSGGARLILSHAGGAAIRLPAGGRIEAEAGSAFELHQGEWHGSGGALAGRVVAAHVTLRLEASAEGSGPLVAAGVCRLERHTAGAELWVQGGNLFGHAVLETLPDAPISGPVRFESVDGGWRSELNAAAGARVLAGGVLRVRAGSGGSRNFTGSLSNAGRIEVADDTATWFTGHYLGAGGVTLGPFVVFNSTVEFTASPAPPPGRLVVVGAENVLRSDVPAGQTLRLEGRNGGGHARLRLPQDVAVAGRMELESLHGAWSASVELDPDRTLTLLDGGELWTGRGSAGARRLNGRVINFGTISIEGGIMLSLGGTAPALVQHGAVTVAESGRLELLGGRFDWQGGSLAGEVLAVNAAAHIAGQVTVPGTLIVCGANAVLEGNASSAATVWVRGQDHYGHARLRLPVTALNRGTLRLESRDGGWQSTLLAEAGASLVHEGLLLVNPGSGGVREFTGDFVHRGRIEVREGAHLVFRGSYEAGGGTVAGSHELLDVQMRLSAAPATPATFHLTGAFGRLLTDTLPNTTLRLLGNNLRGHAALGLPAPFVNRGTLELTGEGGAWRAALTPDSGGAFSNAPGTRLILAAGSGGLRRISGPVDNAGELELGGNVQITGRLRNFPGAQVRGAGALNLNGEVFENAGELHPGASYGRLHIGGGFRQSPPGRLLLKLGGSAAQGGEYDQLALDLDAELGGALEVTAPAGFAPAAGAEYPLITARLRTGQFAPLTRPALPAPHAWRVDYTARELKLRVIEGDPALEPPFITHQPASRYARQGESVTLAVAATGSAPLSYQWFANDTILTGQTNPTLMVIVGAATETRYRAEVRNAAGAVVSDPASVFRLVGVIPAEAAVRPALPPVPGDGTLIELFNEIGGGRAPAPADLEGLAPTGVTRAPFVDFPRPGAVVNVGGQFDLFFASTTVPPESVRGLAARNFILRTRPLLAVSRALDLDPATPPIELLLGVGSDDGFDLRAGDIFLGNAGDRPFTYTWMPVSFAAEGLYPLTLHFAANAVGQSGLELAWRTAPTPAGEVIPQAALYTAPDLGDRLITFEELPAGTVVSNQFAALGVVFTTTGGVRVTDAQPTRFVPVSAPHVLGDPATGGAAPGSVEFRFTGPGGTGNGVTDFVSFFVIDAEATGAVVTAYDPDGTPLHRSEHRAGAGTQERVIVAAPNLARVVVTLGAGDDTVALDNLSFTAPRAFNRPPQITGPGDAVVDELTTFSVQYTASDPDWGDTVRFALVPPVPAGVRLDPQTGLLTWPITEAQGPGDYLLRVRALDAGEPPLSADHILRVRVREVNQPPTLPPLAPRLIPAGTPFEQQLFAFDADLPAQALTFALESGPAGLQLSPQGRLTWTPPPGAAGDFEARFRVSDSFHPPGTVAGVQVLRVFSGPDLQITRLEGPAAGETGAPFHVTYREANLGTAPATGAWVQRLFLSTDPRLDDGDTLLGEFAFSGTMNPGQFLERTLQFRLPNASGRYWLIAVADAANAVQETAEDNNIGASAAPIEVGAAYTATVQTDFEVGLAGTPIAMHGVAQRRGGAPAAFEPVSVHVRVRGTTRVLGALTDERGRFTLVFRPLPGEAGDYTIGAAHPGEATAPVQDGFRLLGMEFAPAEADFDLRALGAATRRVVLRNRSETALSGLTVAVENLSTTLRLDFNPPATLPGGAELPLDVRVTSTADESIRGTVVLRLLSAEGALATLRLNVQTRSLAPVLVAEPGALEAAMLRGGQTVVHFTVRNAGGRPTGPLNVLLPPAAWLATVTPGPLPPLEPGAETTLSLQLTPAADLPLAVYPGALVVTDGGAAVNVPFRFAAVSDARATLRVETVDEFTYYAEGSPRVRDARVEVRDKLTGAVAARGTTGADGTVTFADLREGYYEVHASAEEHNDSRETVLVTAGTRNEHQAFLVRQLVKYFFTVEEVALEERTRVTIESVFETVVPAPVVTVEPNFIDLNAITQDRVEIELKITNHGLIAAQAARLEFGPSSRFTFTLLQSELGDLPARSSVTVPLVIERRRAGPRTAGPELHDGGGDCPVARLLYELICGPRRNTYSVPIGLTGRCGGGGGNFTFSGGGGGGGGGGPLLGAAVYWGPSVPCDPCAEKILMILAECIFDLLPIPNPIPCIKGAAGCYNDPSWLGCIGAGVSCFKAAVKEVPFIGEIITTLDCLNKLENACKDLKPAGNVPGGGRAGRPQLQSRLHGTDPTTFPGLNRVAEQARRLRAHVGFFRVLLGEDAWLHGGQTVAFNDFLAAFADAIAPNSDEGSRVSAAERAALMAGPLPVGGDANTAARFLDRWNRSLDYQARGIANVADVPPGESADFIARDEFRAAVQAASEAIALNEAEGFTDPLTAAKAAVDRLRANLAEAAGTGGVCARVRLRLDQEAVQTRQGFKATLDLVNDSGERLEGVRVNLEVRDETGALAGARFGITGPELSGVSDVTGTGVVTPGTTGRATWLIIPGHEAAPSPAPARYFVGGEFSYVQAGTRVRVPLTPVAINVHPTPRLALTYFHERDVRADDPFTDEVEPSIPYSLAVLVRNVGFGPARNLRITSSQPKIIENEKGLLIHFDLLATQVDNESLTPSLTADLGDVPPGGTRQARWLLRSSLQGQFIEYSATFEHLGVFSQFPELASIQSVAIHELIHLVRATGPDDDGLPDFLVNDVPDDDFLPDTLHLSLGGTQPVAVVRAAAWDGAPHPGDLEVSYTANAPAGWVYFRLPDPGAGRFRVTRVLRADGSEVSFGDNVWTTDRTFIAGGRRPVYEHNLHLFDRLAAAGPVTYRVQYAPPPPADTTPPGSRIAELPASSGPQIPVQWDGADEPGGSGLAGFDIYVRVDDGSFTRWLHNVTARGAIYTGEPGRTYAFYSVAVDRAGNRQPAPAAPHAQTTVNRTNTRPVLSAPGRLVVDEGVPVVFTATAADADVPPDLLTFSLGPDAPPGAVIHPRTGLFTWPTGEGTGPSTNRFTVIVTDNGLPPLADSAVVEVIVREVNEPPLLAPLADVVINEGTPLALQVRASDPDLPPQTLTYRLGGALPAGLGISPAGHITWTPNEFQGPSTNRVEVIVSDGAAETAVSFRIVVRDTRPDLTLSMGRTHLRAGQAGTLPVTLAAGVDLAVTFNLELQGAATAAGLSGLSLTAGTGLFSGLALVPLGPLTYEAQLTLAPGAAALGPQTARLQFHTAADTPSGRAVVHLREVTGRFGDLVLTRPRLEHGRIIVVNREPVLELEKTPDLRLRLFGRPGVSYLLETRDSLASGSAWEFEAILPVDGSGLTERVVNPPPGVTELYLRALEP